jgi:hypothetical protein
VLRRSLASIALGLLVLAATDASASVTRCWGKMRTMACEETDQTWDADGHPTFSAGCEGCGSTPEGGACMPVAAGPYGLSLMVGGRSYGADHFEVLTASCGSDWLFRYNGPLEPGKSHEIWLPGNVDYSQPKRFTLNFFVADAPPVDAGLDAGAPAADGPAVTTSADGPPATATADAAPASRPDRGGCSYAPMARPPLALAGAVILAVLSLRRRSRRAPIGR